MAKKRVSKKVAKIVRNYTQRLSEEEKLPIKRVMIFGSQATGKTHTWSDIDVCIISPKFKNALKAVEFLLTKRKREEVMAGLEPVGFTEEDFATSSAFLNEIKRTGFELKLN
ncbi:MAG: nucleotidyltransferase domain-containing protein [Patescibacteria group bacterium]|nr:nucleotidyltransferase domain-containing protein [Patescibacteria group bacterium]